MQIIVNKEDYLCVQSESVEDKTYNCLLINNKGKLLKDCIIEAKNIGEAIQEAEFELIKEKFRNDNERLFELITILGVNGLDLVQFIKNDLDGFKECEDIKDLHRNNGG